MKYRGVEFVWYHNNWYHPNFFTRGPACIKRAKYTCQHCKVPQGGWYITKEGRLSSEGAVIQACHVNHDPWNPRAKLIALCKPCHLVYDGPMHGEKAGKTKRRQRVQKQVDAGQITFNWKSRKYRKKVS